MENGDRCDNGLDTMLYKKYSNPLKHKVVNIIRRRIKSTTSAKMCGGPSPPRKKHK